VTEDWKKAWEPMQAAIGRDFSDGRPVWGADAVEPGGIRRYLEMLEFDCPLHHDRDAARAQGYRDIIHLACAAGPMAIPPHWKPGGPTIFNSDHAHAQPDHSPIRGIQSDLMPGTTGYLATEAEIDYFLPLYPGDRVCLVGSVLLSVEPKETRVGRGAFCVFETQMRNQRDELVARRRAGMYYYNPKQ
jgi:hypothetical protein